MPSLIEHIQLSVSNFEKSKEFYSQIADWFGFKNLGEYEGDDEFPRTVGFLKDGLKLLISKSQRKGEHAHGSPGLHHLAFRVETKADVDRFYREVIRNLEAVHIQDPPAECPEYGNNYYATFFLILMA